MIALVLAGFLSLAAGTYRSGRLLFGRVLPVRARALLLTLGHALLAVSLWRVLAGDDPARRLVEWFGLLTLCALILVASLWLWGRRGG